MDYFVPEKVPQPKNVLESLVWDREKEVDRARERFQVMLLLICSLSLLTIFSDVLDHFFYARCNPFAASISLVTSLL